MNLIRRLQNWWHRRRHGHEPDWVEGAFDQIGWDRFCEVCADEAARALLDELVVMPAPTHLTPAVDLAPGHTHPYSSCRGCHPER
jgi:hypothetical protein